MKVSAAPRPGSRMMSRATAASAKRTVTEGNSASGVP
jgi:hypothetical protein